MKNRYRLDSKEENDLEKELPEYVKNEIWEILMNELLLIDHWKKINWKLVNKIDITNLKWLNDIEIENLLNKILEKKRKEKIIEWEVYYSKTSIDDKEWIDFFNSIFLKALRFYKDELKWTIPKKYTDKKHFFRNKNDLIAFLKETQKWTLTSQFNCSISKVIYAINEIIDTPELLELDKKSLYLVKEKISHSIMIDDYESLKNFWISWWKVVVSDKIINFKMRIRGKEEKSWAIKILKDESYLKWKDLLDAIWIEFEVENKKDALLILFYLYHTVFHKEIHTWEIVNTIKKFKNKWIISKELIQELENQKLIYWDFLEIIKKLDYSPNPMQNNDFQDVKYIWEVDIPENLSDENSPKKPHSVELRAILVWNLNEEWLSDHRILHTWKIILSWIRLKWYITEPFIKYLINILLEENNDLDKKFRKNEILDYYTSKLMEIERKGKIKAYTIKDRNIIDIFNNY